VIAKYPEYLEGFYKRMQVSGAVDSIVNRRERKMDIENRFNSGDLENILFSLLVFIMEKTLSEDNECSINNIADFLGLILPFYGEIDIDNLILAEYLVKDILQNGGKPRFFDIMDYSAGKIKYRVKLIDDKVIYTEKSYKVIYRLTDQGYDFLFRTKEVDDEISFTIEELKLKELIKRKNYKKAVLQSRSLVQMVRQKKSEILRFLEKLRENIYSVDVAEYEIIIKGTYALLEDEYKVMDDIHKTVKLSEFNLFKDENSDSDNVEIRKAKNDIAEILKNIDRTVSEQRELIINRHNLSKIYIDTIGDSFSKTINRRFDIEDEILCVMEKLSEDKYCCLWKLFNPIFKPDIKNILNLIKLYERQYKLREKEFANFSDIVENLTENDESIIFLEKERTNAYIDIVKNIMIYGKEFNKFRFSDFFSFLNEKYENIDVFTSEERIFRTMLKLYDIGLLDIIAWKKERENIIADISGEFDANVCLYAIEDENPDIYNVISIKISKDDNVNFECEYTISENNLNINKKIILSDFLIEVQI